MKKKIIIKESQLKKLIEVKQDEVNIAMVGKELKNLPCSGESIKTLVTNRLLDLGYSDVKINFMGYEDETNNLMYSIYTEGPMFVVKAQSSHSEKPCLDIVYVQAYDKVQLGFEI